MGRPCGDAPEYHGGSSVSRGPGNPWESKLKAFLYLLVRDELPFGKVERILKDIERADHDNPIVYSEGVQAVYAEQLTKRLMERL